MMDTLERFSCLLDKQYLFKEGKNKYYNRYIMEYQNYENAEDWLYEMLSHRENDIEDNRT